MALKITRPSDSMGPENKIKLSPAGKIIIIVSILAVIAAVVFGTNALSAQRKKNTLEQSLLNQIDRSVAVCEAGLTALDAEDHIFNDFYKKKEAVSEERRTERKVQLALELLLYVSGYAENNPDIMDELNGARNRIFAAQAELSGG